MKTLDVPNASSGCHDEQNDCGYIKGSSSVDSRDSFRIFRLFCLPVSACYPLS